MEWTKWRFSFIIWLHRISLFVFLLRLTVKCWRLYSIWFFDSGLWIVAWNEEVNEQTFTLKHTLKTQSITGISVRRWYYILWCCGKLFKKKSTSLCDGCCDTLAYSLGCKWTLEGRCQYSQFSRHHFDWPPRKCSSPWPHRLLFRLLLNYRPVCS